MTTPNQFTPDEASLVVAAAAPFIPSLGVALRNADNETLVALAVIIAEVTAERSPMSVGAVLVTNAEAVTTIIDKIRNLPIPDAPVGGRKLSLKAFSALMYHPHINRGNVLLATAIGGLIAVSVLMGLGRIDGNGMAAGFLMTLGGAFLQCFLAAFGKEFGGNFTSTLGLGKPGEPAFKATLQATSAAVKSPKPTS